MARNLTDPDGNGILEWTEEVTDADGDLLDFTLELDAVDSGGGFLPQGTDSSNVSWLSFEIFDTAPQPDSSRNYSIKIFADTNGLTSGNDYRFELIASDGDFSISRKFVLSVS